MAQAGKDVEKIVLARALKLVVEDRVFVSGNKTVILIEITNTAKKGKTHG